MYDVIQVLLHAVIYSSQDLVNCMVKSKHSSSALSHATSSTLLQDLFDHPLSQFLSQAASGCSEAVVSAAVSAANASANTYFQAWTQNMQELVSEPVLDGSTAAKAAPSAKYIQTAFNNYTDGVYWINLPYVGPTQVYCLLRNSVDGGGWI